MVLKMLIVVSCSCITLSFSLHSSPDCSSRLFVPSTLPRASICEVNIPCKLLIARWAAPIPSTTSPTACVHGPSVASCFGCGGLALLPSRDHPPPFRLSVSEITGKPSCMRSAMGTKANVMNWRVEVVATKEIWPFQELVRPILESKTNLF